MMDTKEAYISLLEEDDSGDEPFPEWEMLTSEQRLKVDRLWDRALDEALFDLADGVSRMLRK